MLWRALSALLPNRAAPRWYLGCQAPATSPPSRATPFLSLPPAELYSSMPALLVRGHAVDPFALHTRVPAFPLSSYDLHAAVAEGHHSGSCSLFLRRSPAVSR